MRRVRQRGEQVGPQKRHIPLERREKFHGVRRLPVGFRRFLHAVFAVAAAPRPRFPERRVRDRLVLRVQRHVAALHGRGGVSRHLRQNARRGVQPAFQRRELRVEQLRGPVRDAPRLGGRRAAPVCHFFFLRRERAHLLRALCAQFAEKRVHLRARHGGEAVRLVRQRFILFVDETAEHGFDLRKAAQCLQFVRIRHARAEHALRHRLLGGRERPRRGARHAACGRRDEQRRSARRDRVRHGLRRPRAAQFFQHCIQLFPRALRQRRAHGIRRAGGVCGQRVGQSAVEPARDELDAPHALARELPREQRDVGVVEKIPRVAQKERRVARLQKFLRALRARGQRVVQPRRVHNRQPAQFLPAQAERHALHERREHPAADRVLEQRRERRFVGTRERLLTFFRARVAPRALPLNGFHQFARAVHRGRVQRHGGRLFERRPVRRRVVFHAHGRLRRIFQTRQH